MNLNKTPFEASLRDVLSILFKRKWSIITIFITVIVSAVFYLWFVRGDNYDTTAKILVRIGYEQMNTPTVVGERTAIYGQRSQDVNSEIDILQSTDLIGKVVDYLKLDREQPEPVPDRLVPRIRYEVKRVVKGFRNFTDEIFIACGMRERLTPREKTIAQLTKGLKVIAMKDSNVIVANLKVPIRKNANVILNTLLDFYLDFRLSAFQDPSLVNFLSSQAKASRGKLDSAVEALHRFETESDIVSLNYQKELLLRQIAEARSLFTEAELTYQEISGKAARLNKELKSDEPDFGKLGSFGEGTFPDSLVQELATLQKEREQIRMGYKDPTVRIKYNRHQFNTLLGLLSSNVQSVLTEKKALYEARLNILQNLQNKLDLLHSREAKWDQFRRNVQVMDDEYMLLEKKFKEGTSTDALKHGKIGNVAIIQRAIDPVAPSGMRKATMLVLSMLFGMFASLAWVAVAEFFDHGIYSADELARHIDAPVLESIPFFRKNG